MCHGCLYWSSVNKMTPAIVKDITQNYFPLKFYNLLLFEIIYVAAGKHQKTQKN